MDIPSRRLEEAAQVYFTSDDSSIYRASITLNAERKSDVCTCMYKGCAGACTASRQSCNMSAHKIQELTPSNQQRRDT